MFDHWSHFIAAPIAIYISLYIVVSWPRWKEEARINALYIEDRKRRKKEEKENLVRFER